MHRALIKTKMITSVKIWAGLLEHRINALVSIEAKYPKGPKLSRKEKALIMCWRFKKKKEIKQTVAKVID